MRGDAVYKKLCEVAAVYDSLHKTPSYTDKGYPMVRGTDIKTGYLHLANCLRVDEETYLKFIEKYVPQRGDILITRVGSYGNFSYVETNEKFCLGQNTTIISPKINSKYLYYCLLTGFVTDQIEHKVVGSSQKTLSLKYINGLELPIFPQDVQEKIVQLFGTLDEKIEINKKIISNLCTQAETLFESWFESRLTSEESASTFEAELASKGWRILNLGEITENIRDRVGKDTCQVLSAVNTGKLVLSEEYFTKQVFSKDISKYIVVKEGDFAYNPARVNIGSIGINDLGFAGCVSPVYVVFSTRSEYRNYIEVFIKTNRFREEVKKRASGSVRQSMNYSDFSLIKIMCPPKKMLDDFNVWYAPVRGQIKQAEAEISKLVEIRDALLDRVFSGEADIDDISTAV